MEKYILLNFALKSEMFMVYQHRLIWSNAVLFQNQSLRVDGVFFFSCIFSKTSSAGNCNYSHIYLLTSLGDNLAILWLQNYGSL